LRDCPPIGSDFEHRALLHDATTVDARQVGEMLQQHESVGYIFPDQQKLVFADRVLNKILSELWSRCTSMLGYDATCGSENTFPPALPGLIRKINIFHIEGMVERVQAAYRLILLPVNRTRTAAGPQNGNGSAGLLNGTYFIVP